MAMAMYIPEQARMFEATVDEAAKVAKLLASILVQEKSQAVCLFRITKDSIRATIEQSKVMQGTAILTRDLFSQYIFNSANDMIEVRIDLRNLIKCISLYIYEPSEDLTYPNNDSNLDIHFQLVFRLIDEDSPLQVVIKGAGIETECEIATLATTVGFGVFPEFLPNNTASKLIIGIELWGEIWQMFDLQSDNIGVKVSKQAFSFNMESFCGSTSIQIDAHHEGVEKFECDLSPEICSSYRTEILKKALKPMSISSNVTFTTSMDGFLSIKYNIELNNSIEEVSAFVEYVFRSRHEDRYESGDMSLN